MRVRRDWSVDAGVVYATAGAPAAISTGASAITVFVSAGIAGTEAGAGGVNDARAGAASIDGNIADCGAPTEALLDGDGGAGGSGRAMASDPADGFSIDVRSV